MGTGATSRRGTPRREGGTPLSFPFLQGAGEFDCPNPGCGVSADKPPSLPPCMCLLQLKPALLMLFVYQTYALKLCRQGEVI